MTHKIALAEADVIGKTLAQVRHVDFDTAYPVLDSDFKIIGLYYSGGTTTAEEQELLEGRCLSEPLQAFVPEEFVSERNPACKQITESGATVTDGQGQYAVVKFACGVGCYYAWAEPEDCDADNAMIVTDFDAE